MLQFSLRSMLIAIALFTISVSTAIGLWAAALSWETIDRVDDGMIRMQVRELAGNPNYISLEGDWHYRVWNGIEIMDRSFIVKFDETDRVFWTSF